jgi:hypothetical protein
MRQILISLLLAIVPGSTAFAATIDFEDLMHDDNQIFELPPIYYSGNFVLTNTATEESSGFPPSFATLGTQVYGFSGSTALFNNNYEGTTVLTALRGWTINLYSITLSELFPADTTFDVVFTGNRADGSTVQQTFTLDGVLRTSCSVVTSRTLARSPGARRRTFISSTTSPRTRSPNLRPAILPSAVRSCSWDLRSGAGADAGCN